MRWPPFAGELFDDAVRLAPYATDFGRTARATPLSVLRAADADDVARAIRFARSERLEVVARGQAHTTRGQTLSRGGLIIDTMRLDRVLDVGGDTARVQAGVRWQELLRATLPARLTPPVLTDYIDLSVAGTLSVGGVGGQSFRHGLQLDNVRELVVATGEGELVRCSPARDAALFDACLGGLGQFGVIVEATVQLVAAPVEVRVLELAYDDLAAFLRAQLALVEDGRFDYVLGNFHRSAGGSGIAAWRYSIECVHHAGAGGAASRSDAELLRGLDFIGTPATRTLAYFDYANRLAAMVTEMKRAGTWQGAHPWIDLFLPASKAAPVIEPMLAELSHDEVAGGYVMTYPLVRRRCRTSFPGLPADEQLFLFDILPSFSAGQTSLLPAFSEKCARLLARARAAGATVYPIGLPIGTADMRASDWRRQLGAAYDGLARLQRQLDPDGILRRGLDIFP